jgi:hypothetical protein
VFVTARAIPGCFWGLKNKAELVGLFRAVLAVHDDFNGSQTILGSFAPSP